MEGNLGEERNGSVKSRARVHVSEWNVIRNCSDAICPAATYHRMGSTLQSNGDKSTEVNKRTQCGWNNWMKMAGVLCDKRVPQHVKATI